MTTGKNYSQKNLTINESIKFIVDSEKKILETVLKNMDILKIKQTDILTNDEIISCIDFNNFKGIDETPWMHKTPVP